MNFAGGFNPASIRQPHVHDHHIGLGAHRAGDRVRYIARLGDDANVRFGLQDQPNSLANHLVVLSDEHPNVSHLQRSARFSQLSRSQ
jgi:hypothetical protein